jgi:hypothetical protein
MVCDYHKIYIILHDKPIIKKIKPNNPNNFEKKKYFETIYSINKNSHRNLIRYIKQLGGKNIKSILLFNLIIFDDYNNIYKKIQNNKKIKYLEIYNNDSIKLPENELHNFNKKIKKNNWAIKRINNCDIVINNNITLGILDTGIKECYSEFNNIKSTSFVKSELNTNDYNGHGTHIAGIIAGKTTGICSNINILNIKCFDKFGNGSLSNIIHGIDYALYNYCNIIQLYINKHIFNNILKNIINKAKSYWLHICCSNNNIKNVLSTGSIDQNNNKLDIYKHYCPSQNIYTTNLKGYAIRNGIYCATAYLTATIIKIIQSNYNIFPWNLKLYTDEYNVIDLYKSVNYSLNN